METRNYHIGPPIDKGGMATVYEGTHKTLGHKVAIKVLNKEYFYNDNIRKRFLAEARILAGISHNNIIRVTDLIEEKESAAFVMEYIKGSNLRDYIDYKGKLPEDEIKYLFSQMLDAVGFVHEQGLIHRDIKPSNFMLDSQGNIKLLDFGIAKVQDPSAAEYTQTGTDVRMGTPLYMSPEQIKSTKDVTAQSDIYSLGVVLWQMVTGRNPYDGNSLSTFEIKSKIFNESLPKTGTVWDEIIEKATNKNLKNRYKNCSVVLADRKEDIIKKTAELKNNLPHDSTIIDDLFLINKPIDSKEIHEISILQQLREINKDGLINFDNIESAKREGRLRSEILDSRENLFNVPSNIYTFLSHLFLVIIYILTIYLFRYDIEQFMKIGPNDPFRNSPVLLKIVIILGLIVFLFIHFVLAEILYSSKRRYQYFYARNEKFVDSVIKELMKL